jgi:hypothetical protein
VSASTRIALRNEPFYCCEEASIYRSFLMGRAGIEPATLGLKVRLDKLRRSAANGNVLKIARFMVATNCSEMQRAETSLYAHCTPTALARSTTRPASYETVAER